MTSNDVSDLEERLNRAVRSLDDLLNKAAALHNTTEYSRLSGKREGVLLVLDWLRGYNRDG